MGDGSQGHAELMQGLLRCEVGGEDRWTCSESWRLVQAGVEVGIVCAKQSFGVWTRLQLKSCKGLDKNHCC